MASSSDRPYDVVIYGASGFTGRLVALHLRAHNEQPSWAIAGRSQKRLEDLRSSLNLSANVGVIVADNGDVASLERMTSQARCIVNLVGPYRKFGASKIIEACIASKTHYVDLNGESLFTQEMIERFHVKARQAGVVIGCSSGYDSVPSDLTTYLAAQHLKRSNANIDVDEVHVSTKCGPVPLELNGAFSTGTLLSIVDMGDEDASQIQFTHAGRLSPVRPKNDSLPFQFAVSEPQFGRMQFGSSWILCPHNVRFVYRTWGLLQQADTKDAYGPSFHYTESLHGGSIIFCFVQALMFYTLNILMTHVQAFRSFLKRTLPPNGGPSDKGQARMKVDIRALAKSRATNKSALCTLFVRGHPGYSVTASLITETGLTLAREQRENLHPLAQQGGVLTAATIGAKPIADRLQRNAGFEIVCKDF